MHLLHCKTLQLKEFHRRDIPPYAILSHTWHPDKFQEVDYDDILCCRGRTKAGFAKIDFCTERALKDKLEWVWVDTCCIDKKNNPELQEAINSMYKWYQRARTCYVYLTDVSIPQLDERPSWLEQHKYVPGTFPKEFREDELWRRFCRSQWFTRGWTLQELLAPRSVEFFVASGEKIGDKDSLGYYIHKVTGIPIAVLRTGIFSLVTTDPLRVVGWAISRRVTKREEDVGYCLWGLFDIQMPALYGEGRKKAIRRLLREIGIHDYEDHVERLSKLIDDDNHRLRHPCTQCSLVFDGSSQLGSVSSRTTPIGGTDRYRCHQKAHILMFRCMEPGCVAEFFTIKGLDYHQQELSQVPAIGFRCYVRDCIVNTVWYGPKGCADHLVSHHNLDLKHQSFSEFVKQ